MLKRAIIDLLVDQKKILDARTPEDAASQVQRIRKSTVKEQTAGQPSKADREISGIADALEAGVGKSGQPLTKEEEEYLKRRLSQLNAAKSARNSISK